MKIKLAETIKINDVILYKNRWEIVRSVTFDLHNCMGHFEFGVQHFIQIDNEQIHTFRKFPFIVKDCK